MNAHVGPDSTPWLRYAQSYRRAAELLTARVAETARDQDFLIFPVAFCWRHYIELTLKDLIQSCALLLNEPRPAPTSHRLSALWDHLQPLLVKVWAAAGASLAFADLHPLVNVVQELDRIDSQSTAFRYPEDTKGGKSLRGITHINYDTLTEHLTAAGFVLDGLQGCVFEFRSWKQDMQSNW